MHWQAKLHNGRIVTGEAEPFGNLSAQEVSEFSIVERYANFCLVLWETNSLPLVYATRQTPNEIVHIVCTPRIKAFIFEGTSEVIQQPSWGHGIFAPIASE